jgi:hypothetical protein
MFPKPVRYKNPQYRRFVASHPCFLCGIEGYSQCAHRNGAGMATKFSDLETFPLCATRVGIPGCHAMHDQCVDMTCTERQMLEDEYVNRMQAISRAAGRPEFK